LLLASRDRPWLPTDVGVSIRRLTGAGNGPEVPGRAVSGAKVPASRTAARPPAPHGWSPWHRGTFAFGSAPKGPGPARSRRDTLVSNQGRW